MKHEANKNNSETIALLDEIFSGQGKLRITQSSDGNKVLRGYFRDDDAGMGYGDDSRFEGIVCALDDAGNNVYIAEKFLPNLPSTVWFKFNDMTKELHLIKIEGTEQPIEIWQPGIAEDISNFNSLLSDLRNAQQFDDYKSPRTSVLNRGKLYEFTTLQLQ